MKLKSFKKTAFIDLAIEPWRGWGNYAKQLCIALISKEWAFPITPYEASIFDPCSYEWNLMLAAINQKSKDLIKVSKGQPENQFDYGFYGFGNSNTYDENEFSLLKGEKKIAIIFFEHSSLKESYINFLKQFDLVVTGSTWNRSVLAKQGVTNVVKIIQGVDITYFNQIYPQNLLGSRFIIYSGGKLELRKGQDILLKAFKEFLVVCPNSLLICTWSNDSNSFRDIERSPYTKGVPKSGSPEDIFDWITEQGISGDNILVPGTLNTIQISNLMKSADISIFPNRCEGGTNLVAMESLCCGIPTALSSNSGHLDLLSLGLPGIIPLPCTQTNIKSLHQSNLFNQWQEVSPNDLLKLMLKAYKEEGMLGQYKQKMNNKMISSLSWKDSFEKLLGEIELIDNS